MTVGDPGAAVLAADAGRRALAALELLREVATALEGAPDGPGGRSALDGAAAALVRATGCGWSASWAAVAVLDDLAGPAGAGGVLRLVAAGAARAGAGTLRLDGRPAAGAGGADRRGDPPADPLEALLDGWERGPVPVPVAAPWPPDGLTGPVLDRLDVVGGGAGGSLVTALAVRGREDVLGLLLLGTGAPVDGEAAALLDDVARRLRPELELARQDARQQDLTRALEDAATSGHDVPGLDVWTHDGADARTGTGRPGGAWQDVLALGDASVGLAVGQVLGRDPAAAVGQLRSLLRAYADERTEPASVLMRVDQLVEGSRIPGPSSLVYGRLSPLEDGAWEWSWSGAGSAPPLVVHPGEGGSGPVVEVLDGAATPVGHGTGTRTTDAVVLEPGDVVVLGAPGLAGHASHLVPADAAGVGEQLLAALVSTGRADATDGAALVVVRVPWGAEEVVVEPEGTPRQRRWVLRGDPSSIARARRHVLAACGAWGLAAAPEAELVVSELVANAVLHGWGPVGLRVRHGSQGLVVEVDDANPSPPRTHLDLPASRPGGYGLQVVARLAEWGWHRSGTGKTVWAQLPVDAGRT